MAVVQLHNRLLVCIMLSCIGCIVAVDVSKNCTNPPCHLMSCGVGNGTCDQLCGNTLPCRATCAEPLGHCKQSCPNGGCGLLDCKAQSCSPVCRGTGGCPMTCDSLDCRPLCSENCSITCHGTECIARCEKGCHVECLSTTCTLECSRGACSMTTGKHAGIAYLNCPTGDCHLKCHVDTPKDKCQCTNCTSIEYYESAAAMHCSMPFLVLLVLCFTSFMVKL